MRRSLLLGVPGSLVIVVTTLAAMVAGFAGCSLFTSFDGLETGYFAADAAGPDATVNPGTTAQSDSGAPTDADAPPLPPPKPPCDATAKPVANALYVSTTGDDSLAGSAAAPVKTLAAALSLAKSKSATDIYIDEGTYAEAVTITTPATLHGGWKAQGASWSKDCSDTVVGLTIVRSPTTRAVDASGFTGAAGLDTITLVTKAQAESAESAIAVRVSGSGITFSMVGVDVTAASGGDGTTPPTPGPAGNSTCNKNSCSDGAKGGTGGNGTPGGAGTFVESGYAPKNGGAAGNGGPGHAGTPGGAGQSADNCLFDCTPAPTCANGTSFGTATGGTGSCGCGGLGGAAGGGGASGGASIGVYVYGATLTIDHSTVRAAHGGAGAPGAGGGAGGTGTAGTAGSTAFCAGSCFYNGTQCLLSGSQVNGGSKGGAGGAGGSGGTGGDGAGGPSYGIVYAGGGSANIAATTSIQTGAGGAGSGGAPSGASGASFAP